jgi:3-isopropylmalate dehydrogenase
VKFRAAIGIAGGLDTNPQDRPNRTLHVAVLGGDGVGPEVTAAAVEVAQEALQGGSAVVEWQSAPIGHGAFVSTGSSFPEATAKLCEETDAVLLGAIAGPEQSGVKEAEPCLLTLRRQLETYANLRPVRPHPALVAASPLRPEKLEGVDILFVRELTGGIYFGEKSRTDHEAFDLCMYTVVEIERVVRKACELAQNRRGKVTMVDKANVLETSRLWRDTSERLTREEFPDIEYDHVLVDAMAMYLLDRPATFDVIVTENMFGDILTDEASMLAGSMGLLPSAALGDGTKGLYEPIHGTAPDIAGQGIANPCAAILSAAMLLRHSLGLDAAADRVERAVEQTLTDRIWTRDLGGDATTVAFTRAVIDRL